MNILFMEDMWEDFEFQMGEIFYSAITVKIFFLQIVKIFKQWGKKRKENVSYTLVSSDHSTT